MSVDNQTVGKNEEAKENKEAARYLAFSLGGEDYAIPLLQVKEVMGLTEITKVPHTPPHFKGIMNLRGQVISVIDLRVKFNISSSENSSETAIIILDLAPVYLGVIVDHIDSVLAIDADQLAPPPDIETKLGVDYITGVAKKDKKLILMLDLEKTLSVEDLKAMHRKNAETAA